MRSKYATALDIIKRTKSLHKFFHRKHVLKSECILHAYEQYRKTKHSYKAVGASSVVYLYSLLFFLTFILFLLGKEHVTDELFKRYLKETDEEYESDVESDEDDSDGDSDSESDCDDESVDIPRQSGCFRNRYLDQLRAVGTDDWIDTDAPSFSAASSTTSPPSHLL